MILLLVVAPVAVYWNSRHAPFVLDDGPSITENPSIRSLWPLTGPLSPPAGGLPVNARPVANLSLALNYAFGGENPAGYHTVNLALHVLAALVLFGVLRRTLAQPVIPENFREHAYWLALAIVTVWALHPLQTAAVTYVSQRTELLASLFYLLTLYAFIRVGEDPARVKSWALIAVIACLFGMGSKETMASVPLIVLLYDRTFCAGSFAEAWRRRWRLHVALMATWALLLWLVLHSGSRGGTAGFGMGVTPAAYLVTQGEAIMGYLARSVYPYPLVFDYGDYLTPASYGAWLDAALVAGLAVAAVVALRRKPVLGFAGLLFFSLLAPTSSLVPVTTQTIADHRMYLPLAVVLTILALAAHTWLGRRAWLAGLAAALVFAGLTVSRNRDYTSVVSLWRDTVQKRPDNIRAHNNLAAALLESHQTEAGLAELRAALELRPNHPDGLRNLAKAELLAGNTTDALAHIELAQRIDPSSAAGWTLLGATRLRAGQEAQAVDAYRQARQMRPDSQAAAEGLGEALFLSGRNDEALKVLAEASRQQPDYPGLHLTYGGALLDAGKAAQALAEFDAALAHESPTAKLHHLRALALLELGRRPEAAAAVRQALQLEPGYAPGLELEQELRELTGKDASHR